MKFFAAFIICFLLTYLFIHVLKKRQKEKVVKNGWKLVIPLIVSMAIIVLFIVFSLNFNGKVI